MTGPHEAALPPFQVGSTVRISRTISESDVYLFAGLTGDLGPNHIDAEFSSRTAYGQRVVHGAYLLGLASAASTLFLTTFDKGDYRGASYGYDKLRFIKPVFIGDTITMTYTTTAIEPETLKSYASVVGTNQRDQTCFAATHICKGLPVDKS